VELSSEVVNSERHHTKICIISIEF